MADSVTPRRSVRTEASGSPTSDGSGTWLTSPLLGCSSGWYGAHVRADGAPSATTGLRDDHIGPREALRLAEGVVGGQGAGAVGDRLDGAVGGQVQVHAVHVE